jgi:hypothetical protein
MEELLLALFRASELPAMDSEGKGIAAPHAAVPMPNPAELKRVDGSNHIR